MSNQIRRIKTDVLIIGGGIAGLNAALAAREQGAQVLIMDKGAIARSGNIGAGTDHFVAYLEEGEPWDTQDAWLEYVARLGRGAADLRVNEAIFCKEIKAAIERMTRIGNRLNDPTTARFIRTAAFGQPGPYCINFKGKNFKVNLAQAVKAANIQVLEKVAATKIFVKGQRANGAMGFHIRSGDIYAVAAKALVVCTGHTNRLYENPTGLAFNTWYSPYNCGDGHALAFRAGAELANMEYIYLNLVPRGFSAAGLAALVGMGCHIVNSSGECFMSQYHPQAERAPRPVLVEAVLAEINQGRGPVYIDASHLSSEKLSHLNQTLGWDKDTLPDFLAQKGIDLGKDPLEIALSEASVMGPEPVNSAGVRIDGKCASSLAGLFAAGDGADQMRAVSGATCGGFVAGREAAKIKAILALDQAQLVDEIERISAPLSRRNGVHFFELEEVLRTIMWQLAGPAREEEGLAWAQKKIERLSEVEKELSARNYHELMRVHEARNLLTVARMTVAAARFRQESRFGVCHKRMDFPHTDNENWQGLVLVKKEEEAIKLSFKPLSY